MWELILVWVILCTADISRTEAWLYPEDNFWNNRNKIQNFQNTHRLLYNWPVLIWRCVGRLDFSAVKWLVVSDNILVLLEVVSATSARAAVWEQESSHCPAALMAAPLVLRAVHNIRRPSIKILVLWILTFEQIRLNLAALLLDCSWLAVYLSLVESGQAWQVPCFRYWLQRGLLAMQGGILLLVSCQRYQNKRKGILKTINLVQTANLHT